MGSTSSRFKAHAGPAQEKHSDGHEIHSCADALARAAAALEEAQDVNVPDKFERLATIGHLQVDWELVRGRTLRDTLRKGGRMWLRSPMDLDFSTREAIWSRSRPVKKFDMFLSHTWKTPGIQKVLALLLQSGYKSLLVLWFCGVAVAAHLTAYNRLPLPWSFEVDILDFEATCRAGPWVLLASILCPLLGLLASPYLRWTGAEDDCFIDVASIHQTDPKLMERGIYGIGGFLSISRELRVLWSPEYLSRLWCVFELAAYRTANPTGKITLAPLFVEIIVYVGAAMNLATSTAWWMGRSAFGHVFGEGTALITALLPCFVAMHLLRKTYMAKHQLLSDLEHFDLSKVQCSNDFDKDFIYAAIEDWYGSKDAFTNFVRGPLRGELLGTMTSSPSLAYSLIIISPALASGLTFVSALCVSGAPARCVFAYIFGSFLAFNVCFLLTELTVLLYLCDRFAEPRKPGLRDYGQTLILFIPILALLYMAGFVSRAVRARSLCASLAWFAATFLCMCMSLKILRPLPKGAGS